MLTGDVVDLDETFPLAGGGFDGRPFPSGNVHRYERTNQWGRYVANCGRTGGRVVDEFPPGARRCLDCFPGWTWSE